MLFRSLRVNVGGWRWYVDLKDATTTQNKGYFTSLLEALPPETILMQGRTDGTWTETTVDTLVSTHRLTDYQYRGFSDVGTSPYKTEINTLATYGILQGDGAGHYLPNDSITRAELCAMLTQALGLTAESGATQFTDVHEGAWYAKSVKAAANAGLVEGMGNGRFAPNDTVTQEQMIAIIGRLGVRLNAYLYEDNKAWPVENQVPAGFSDWAKQWVWLLSESQKDVVGNTENLLHLKPTSIKPQAVALREDVAAVLYNVLSYIDVLPV